MFQGKPSGLTVNYLGVADQLKSAFATTQGTEFPRPDGLTTFNQIAEEQTNASDVWEAHWHPCCRLPSVEPTTGGKRKDYVVSRGCLLGQPVQTDAVSVTDRVHLTLGLGCAFLLNKTTDFYLNPWSE